ncbi:MAG: hypothetical protein WBA45_04430 [Microthrixaceae bacterium]
MKRKMLLGLALALLVAGAALVFLFRPTGGTAVAKKDAVDSFRKNQKAPDEGSRTRDAGGRPAAHDPVAPPVGVYTYIASGQQKIKLGPLPEETRTLPSEIVAGVIADPGKASGGAAVDDCFTFELNLFVEHIERTRYCLDGGSLRLDEHDKAMKIGPVSATADLDCSPKMSIAVDQPISGRSCQLKLSGGPMSVEANFEGSTEIGDETSLEIDGGSVAVRLVTITYVASGSVTGTWVERFWLSTADWLPVRIQRDVALVGPTTLTENSQLTLKSMEPAV